MAKSENHIVLFESRMDKEGRTKEYRNEIKRVQRDHGLRYSQARERAMVNMGFKDIKTELLLKQAWERQVAIGRAVIEEREIVETTREDEEQIAFETAFAALPETAPVQIELDWIRSHEAMTRKSRDPDLEVVPIKLRDILNAPSKSGVIALQNWANNPGKFFEKMLAEHSKKTTEESEKPTGAQAEVDVREAEELLRSV